MDDYTSSLSVYGLAYVPTPVQDSSLQISQEYSQGSLPATAITGNITQQLIIGDASNPASAIYLDYQGIYAGSSVFSQAPFSVDLNGNVVANNLVITGVISTGGAAADINSHTTTVNGSQITAASITGSQIANSTITGSNIFSGTITGSLIQGATITGGNIANATISGANIAANTITATNISVTNLSAISADLGTITAGTINGTTITGATIETASSGQRIALTNGGNTSLSFYDTNGLAGYVFGSYSGGIHTLNITGASTSGTGTLGLSGSPGSGYIYCESTGDVVISGFVGTNTIYLQSNTSVIGTFSASGTKSFDIDHPAREGWRLRYAAIESNEVLVMCRGKGKVVLPQHFIDVSESDTLQVIKSGWPWRRTWIATAIRKGFNNYINEYQGEYPG